MKKGQIILIVVICVALVCGAFYTVNAAKNRSHKEEKELTAVEKLITRDLEDNYPNTPREVVKFYNRILDCYYDEKYSSEEFDKLCTQALNLFDDELRANNPKAAYMASVQADVEAFHDAKKTMTQYDVCDSNDVKYMKDKEKDDELAYVEASYFIKEKNSFSKTYQTYVLRKDDSGNWKILVYYQSEGTSEKDD